MARSARQMKILELIQKKDIETQEDLAAELMLAHFNVTQATVSRDIKELGLIKVTSPDGSQRYVKEQGDRSIENKMFAMFRSSVTAIDSAMNIVVIKTLSGSASAAGLIVDKLAGSDVLGCVAGDDTVMIVTRNEDAAAALLGTLNEVINE